MPQPFRGVSGATGSDPCLSPRGERPPTSASAGEGPAESRGASSALPSGLPDPSPSPPSAAAGERVSEADRRQHLERGAPMTLAPRLCRSSPAARGEANSPETRKPASRFPRWLPGRDPCGQGAEPRARRRARPRNHEETAPVAAGSLPIRRAVAGCRLEGFKRPWLGRDDDR
jgi:hypothetical protein